jgi:hypothetical protein
VEIQPALGDHVRNGSFELRCCVLWAVLEVADIGHCIVREGEHPLHDQLEAREAF